MFDIFLKPNSDKTISEKGLENVIEYSNKTSRDIAKLAEHNRVASNNFITFGSGHSEDMSDVTSRTGHLFVEWSNVLMEFSDVMIQYRDTLKSIAVKEATLQSSREQKRKLRESIDKLQGSLSSLDKLNALKVQLAQLEEFTAPDELELENFKRIATREALYNMLNGMHAMASKTDMVANYGKYIVDEFDATPLEMGETRAPYTGQQRTKKMEEEAKLKIDQWTPEKTKFRRTMTTHYGYNPLLDKPLPAVQIQSDQHGPIDDDDDTSTPPPPHPANDGEDNDNSVVIPNRTISLEEQYRQYTFYKPDEI